MVGIEWGIKIRTKSMFGIGIRTVPKSEIRAGFLNPNVLSPRPGSELKARLRSKSKVGQIGIKISIGIEIVNGRYQLASRWHWLYQRYCACVIPLFAPRSGDSCPLRVSTLGHLLKKNTA
ncbi:hypothetical protein EVAR_8890_1 [Eumeta japonica]|uniref:Uncharacterized protein n=1 Tax=Eumeta variegata TaxID=151549 RepID=A0A4C1U0H5_EUMVA|nr:hypothetical protein EVAR_8890_1 [Eumeta japonica]